MASSGEGGFFYALAGDDPDLVEKFRRFAVVKHGWRSTDDVPIRPSSPRLPRRLCNQRDEGGGGDAPVVCPRPELDEDGSPRPRFAVYLGTRADDALNFEAAHSHLSIPFFMAGVLANETGSDSALTNTDSLLESAAFGFVFRNDADNTVGSPLADHLTNSGSTKEEENGTDFGTRKSRGEGSSLAALLSVLQCEPATEQTLSGCVLQLDDAKSFVAASTLAACSRCSPVVTGQQWQVFAFAQDSPPPITYVRRPSSLLSMQSLCVIGCGSLGQEVARELGRRCPVTVERVTFIDPSAVTPFDALCYFSEANSLQSMKEKEDRLGNNDIRYKADVAVRTFEASRSTSKGSSKVNAQSIVDSVKEINLNSSTVKETLASADLWVSAVSSVSTSRLVAQASIEYAKPVVDAAVYPGEEENDETSFCGSVRLFEPRRTESMSCQFETSPSRQPPLCVVSSFPYEVQHAAYWALEKMAKAATKLKGEEVMPRNQSSSSNRRDSLLDCLAKARLYFEKWFHFRVRRLLRAFPLDAVDNTGRPYWTYPKLAPAVLTFDPRDGKHLAFVRTFGQFVARCRVLPGCLQQGEEDVVSREIGCLNDEQLVEALNDVHVPDWDEFTASIKKPISDDPSKVFTGSRLLAASSGNSANGSADDGGVVLSKDDPWCLSLVSLVTRLRCDNYGIDVDERTARGLNRLCWEAASGHSVCDVGACAVAAGVAVSAVNSFLGNLRFGNEVEDGGDGEVEQEVDQPLQENLGCRPRLNAVFATSPVMVQTWTPLPAPVTMATADGRRFTVWDRVKLKGDRRLSLGQLCSRVQALFQQKEPPSMVLQDKSLLYMNGMTKAENVRKLAQDVIRPPPVDVGHVDLFFSFETDDDQDLVAPIVRYEWDYGGSKETASCSSSET